MPYTSYQIGEMVANAAAAAGINPRVAVEQIRQESGFNPNATGPSTRYGTAKGLAQFIDDTWKRYGHGSPYDADAAIAAYVAYMTDLLDMFNERIDLALAAYNWGENRDALRAALRDGKSILNYSIPDQTRNYVSSILTRAGTKATAIYAPLNGSSDNAPSNTAGNNTNGNGSDDNTAAVVTTGAAGAVALALLAAWLLL